MQAQNGTQHTRNFTPSAKKTAACQATPARLCPPLGLAADVLSEGLAGIDDSRNQHIQIRRTHRALCRRILMLRDSVEQLACARFSPEPVFSLRSKKPLPTTPDEKKRTTSHLCGQVVMTGDTSRRGLKVQQKRISRGVGGEKSVLAETMNRRFGVLNLAD